MNERYEDLKDLLLKLFQLDQPDLDFGFYRVMHAKSAEVTQFLEKDLLPQVKAAFVQYQTADKAAIEKELAKAIEQARALGADPETLPKVKELRARLADEAAQTGLEAEVYDYLYTFFRRYYSDGDFLSKRVYKPGVYAIPYEGEEVKLHWANADQYYIKTSEYLRDYAFRLHPQNEKHPMRVHFQLVDAAEGEHGNVKEQAGKERRFKLAANSPVEVENGELIVHFTYQPDPAKQKDLNAAAEQAILGLTDHALAEWIHALGAKHVRADGSVAESTRLRVHLDRYTARNTFDYFIHRDLGGFLRRELDFYIKNEVMHLDDVEGENAPRVEQYLSKIKVIRRIAGKVIDFLAQLEDFQKKLWLKKKFALATSYLISLDRVPVELYTAVAANDKQRQAWVGLFSIDALDGYTEPLSEGFLRQHGNLIVDTSLFDQLFSATVLAAQPDLDASQAGILVHGDNFHALRLAQRRFNGAVKSVYIDPPYNTASSAIPYKNDYKHSSYAAMIRDRLDACYPLLSTDGAIFVSIDKTERTIVEHTLDEIFGAANRIEELIWTQSTANSQLPNYSTHHEYVEVYARSRRAVEGDRAMFREPKPGFAEVMDLIARVEPSYPPSQEVAIALTALFAEHSGQHRGDVEAAGRVWDAEAKRQDPWRGLYPYSRAEYRDSSGDLVADDEASARGARIWVWQELPSGAPASKQSPTTKDPGHPNFRYYRPIHPVTGKTCPYPQGGWKFPARGEGVDAGRRSFEALDADHRIAWGEDETKVPRIKGFLHEVETNIGTSVFYEYNDGEAELADLFGESGLFLSPKSSKFVRRFVVQSTKRDSWFLDFFGGSGSSAHGVIRANREDGGGRRFVLVETANHFDTLLVPRVQKALYASEWRAGKAQSKDGISALLRVVRLETYEDALNNLNLQRADEQQSVLDLAPAQGPDKLHEQYLLRYMLDVETRGSQSLLNVAGFMDPTAYKLKVKRPGSDESREVNVDLLETFNWLIGLTVQHIAAPRTFSASFRRDEDKDLPEDAPRRLLLHDRLIEDPNGPWWFRTVSGTTPDGRRTLVIWRKRPGGESPEGVEQDNLVLDEWFTKQSYSSEFDLIYVNGGNNLENLKAPDDTWKARLIEDDFHRLMFEMDGT